MASTDVSEISAIVSEAASEILHKLGPIPNVCRHPNDDMIITRAVDAAADCIVTGDQDLLIPKHFNDIVIMMQKWCITGFTEMIPCCFSNFTRLYNISNRYRYKIKKQSQLTLPFFHEPIMRLVTA